MKFMYVLSQDVIIATFLTHFMLLICILCFWSLFDEIEKNINRFPQCTKNVVFRFSKCDQIRQEIAATIKCSLKIFWEIFGYNAVFFRKGIFSFVL